MKRKYQVHPIVMFAAGAGVAMVGSYLALLGFGVRLASSTTGWQRVDVAGVISVEIPSTCTFDAGAGNRYLVCPTADNPTPTPELSISSDGITVNVRRWEGLDSPYWEHVVESIVVNQPLTHDVTINIEQ